MLSRLRSVWRNLVHRSEIERDLEDEVGAMHALLVEEKIRAGMDPDSAKTRATLFPCQL